MMITPVIRFFPSWEPTEAREEEGRGRGVHPALPDGRRAPTVPVVLHFTVLHFQVQ